MSNIFFTGQTFRTKFKNIDVMVEISKDLSRNSFVLSWKAGGKNKKERYNRIFTSEELEEIFSGKSGISEKKY